MSENVLNAPAPRAWIAPLLSTIVTVPAAFFAFIYVGLSPMACDSCTDAENARFTPSYETGFTVFSWGLWITVALVAASWTLPWERRHIATRTLLAVLAPVSVLVLYMVFVGIVDWP